MLEGLPVAVACWVLAHLDQSSHARSLRVSREVRRRGEQRAASPAVVCCRGIPKPVASATAAADTDGDDDARPHTVRRHTQQVRAFRRHLESYDFFRTHGYAARAAVDEVTDASANDTVELNAKRGIVGWGAFDLAPHHPLLHRYAPRILDLHCVRLGVADLLRVIAPMAARLTTLCLDAYRVRDLSPVAALVPDLQHLCIYSGYCQSDVAEYAAAVAAVARTYRSWPSLAVQLAAAELDRRDDSPARAALRPCAGLCAFARLRSLTLPFAAECANDMRWIFGLVGCNRVRDDDDEGDCVDHHPFRSLCLPAGDMLTRLTMLPLTGNMPMMWSTVLGRLYPLVDPLPPFERLFRRLPRLVELHMNRTMLTDFARLAPLLPALAVLTGRANMLWFRKSPGSDRDDGDDDRRHTSLVAAPLPDIASPLPEDAKSGGGVTPEAVALSPMSALRECEYYYQWHRHTPQLRRHPIVTRHLDVHALETLTIRHTQSSPDLLPLHLRVVAAQIADLERFERLAHLTLEDAVTLIDASRFRRLCGAASRLETLRFTAGCRPQSFVFDQCVGLGGTVVWRNDFDNFLLPLAGLARLRVLDLGGVDGAASYALPTLPQLREFSSADLLAHVDRLAAACPNLEVLQTALAGWGEEPHLSDADADRREPIAAAVEHLGRFRRLAVLRVVPSANLRHDLPSVLGPVAAYDLLERLSRARTAHCDSSPLSESDSKSLPPSPSPSPSLKIEIGWCRPIAPPVAGIVVRETQPTVACVCLVPVDWHACILGRGDIDRHELAEYESRRTTRPLELLPRVARALRSQSARVRRNARRVRAIWETNGNLRQCREHGLALAVVALLAATMFVKLAVDRWI